MKILQFDSVGGASGDMVLGALIDLGASRDRLQAQLESLGVGAFRIEAAPFSDHGLHGVQVCVRVGGDPPAGGAARAHDHAHDHNHAHDHAHAHAHAHAHDTDGGHGHAHGEPAHGGERDFAAIRELIRKSALTDTVQASSLRVFRRLAEAEAGVHHTTPEAVHFHEVGAVDSIVDIVGSCLALDALHVEAVVVRPLPLGSGTARCRHGVLPVPVPATVELLKGFPVVQTDEPHELVTPTGAALLSTWRSMDAVPARSRMTAVGHGFGHRALRDRPNLLRAILFESRETAPGEAPDECLVLECNVDDTVPELFGNVTEKLLKAGALDVFVTPIQMKKQRPGVLLTALCGASEREALLDLIFRGTTTFGVREYPARRTTLARDVASVDTPYGAVRVKIGRWRGRVITRSPEYDDCVALAEAKHVAVRAVYEAAAHAAAGLNAESGSAP
ncbi:MAG: nickel pincer cofactor biosynthesis protein LarC [Kiritimatiellae bacterium]|nr:nickel pincer cofactor biosynthesis protein LarC [Kiritimatiellia bacterium]